jgi:hypothetical protein
MMLPPYATLAGIVLALALGFAGGWGAQGWRADARVAALNAEIAGQRQAQAESAQLRERAARAEEQRRAAAQQEINDAATRRSEARVRDARAADLAGSGLRIRAAEFAAGASAGASDTGVAAQCEAATDAARVLAELLGRVESAGRRMAAIADERGDAGGACERSYESLTALP